MFTSNPFLKYLVLPFLLILAACSDPVQQPVSESGDVAAQSGAESASTASLSEWLNEIYLEEIANVPEQLTSMGMIEDLDAYGRWSDYSDQSAIETNERSQRYISTMRENFLFDQLNAEEQLSYRFAEYNWELGNDQHQVRTSQYVFSPMPDTISGLVTFLINEHRVESIDHARAYVSRLQGIETVIDALVAEAQMQAAEGVMPPRFAYPRLTESARSLLTGAEFGNAELPGALFNDVSGYYYVNLSNMANNATYLMESPAYNEGAPGHHFQVALAQERQDLPMMQRLTWYSAYGEGGDFCTGHGSRLSITCLPTRP